MTATDESGVPPRNRGVQVFSTEHVPERDRLEVLHDFVGRHVARRQFKPVGDEEVRIELAALDLPGQIIVGAARYSPIVGTRTAKHIEDGRDGYMLSIHRQDHALSVDDRPMTTVRAGDMVLFSEGARSEFHLPQTTLSVISIGREKLAALMPRIESRAFHHVPAQAPSLALLAGYAELLRRNPPDGERACVAAAHHLTELVALVLDGFVQGETERSERSIRAARLGLVKKEIEKRLREPGLSVTAIAKSQGVSPRYLQRLFEIEGVTFSEFVRDRRLELALRLLRGADPQDFGVSAIAYDCGFNDLSHFNRSFRRRFGMTPSDARADAMRRRGG